MNYMPTKKVELNPKQIQATELLASGNTKKSVAEQVGVSYHTLNDWIAKYPEFKESIKKNKKEILTAQRFKKIIETLKKKDMNVVKIAEHLHLSKESIYKKMSGEREINRRDSELLLGLMKDNEVS